MLLVFRNTDGPFPIHLTTWHAVPAVYGILDSAGRVLYVGSTDNLKRRIAEHLADTRHCMHRHDVTSATAEVIPNVADRLRREAELIREYLPPCNDQNP
jgi:excinuclease UvrABC nuclease subunit